MLEIIKEKGNGLICRKNSLKHRSIKLLIPTCNFSAAEYVLHLIPLLNNNSIRKKTLV